MTLARRLGIGAAVAVALVVAAFVALLAWGGVRVVPGGAMQNEPRIAEEAVPIALSEAQALSVPVAGVRREQLTDSWGDARGGGTRAHHGLDIMAAQNTPITAAAAGTVEKLFQSEAGGTTLYVRSPQRRVVYYYAHLAGYAPGVHEGQVVRAGDPLGFVGDTGNAGAGNYHLHFGVSLTTPAQHWYQGTDVDPYPLLAGKAAAR